jgi:hypothetical protein
MSTQPTTVYALGLCYASVCTSTSNEDTTAYVNTKHPTGLDHGWEISSDTHFADGPHKPNPCPCDVHPDTHRHVLYEC